MRAAIVKAINDPASEQIARMGDYVYDLLSPEASVGRTIEKWDETILL